MLGSWVGLTMPQERESADALPKPLVRAAQRLLVLDIEGGGQDTWLWEQARRIAATAQMLALLPEAREIGDDPPDLAAIAAGGLFLNAGWAVQVRDGSVDRWRILSRPTSDILREFGAGLLQEHAADLLPAEVVQRAVAAIRECNDRFTRLPEARALAEAENLDEIGITYILRQFRNFQAEGRSIQQLIVNWTRQNEYHYWEARVNDCLRWETSRHIARERLKVVEVFMNALARDLSATDLRRVFDTSGLDASRLVDLPA